MQYENGKLVLDSSVTNSIYAFLSSKEHHILLIIVYNPQLKIIPSLFKI